MCCVQTDCGNTIFHYGKPLQNLAYQWPFNGQTEERDSRFPRVRLLVLIKDEKYVGWENLMALKVIRLYLYKMRDVIRRQCSF